MSRKSFAAGVVGLAVLLTVALVGSNPASATNGTLVILVDTTLTEDHNGNIEVNANNITLDCDGHSVTGDGTTDGIRVFGSGVTVVNCNLSTFDIGLNGTGGNATLSTFELSWPEVRLIGYGVELGDPVQGLSS